MDDLGPPIAYTAVAEGTPVFDKDGERVGVVDHVVADFGLDIFDGVLVHTLPLPGRHRFADVEQIAAMHERGVVLSVGRDELYEPPGRRRPDDDDSPESPLEARLRRAWDWLSGHR
jgi:hypothetical protein